MARLRDSREIVRTAIGKSARSADADTFAAAGRDDLADAPVRQAEAIEFAFDRGAPSADTTSTKPMPQLKVRHISSFATAPSRCSQSNTGGSTIAEASISRPSPSGTTRMMFSVRPPPVMWAMAWTCGAWLPRSSSSTGFTYSAVGAISASSSLTPSRSRSPGRPARS